MWRKIKFEDIKRGVVIRFSNMNDTPFNGGVIIAFDDELEKEVTIARPIAYAHEYFDTQSPYLYAEVFHMTTGRMCYKESDIEVYEFDSGELLQSIK